MGNGIIFTEFENFARCLKFEIRFSMLRGNINCHVNDYVKRQIRNGGAVSKFMLILKTCKFFAILFDDEYISLFTKYWNIWTEFEKCVYNWQTCI